MKKKYKKQARVAMAVALATTSVANSAGSIFAQEELEISEHDILNNEEVPHSEKAVEDIEINTSNFPDDVFRDYISRFFDFDKDGILSSDELNSVTDINMTSDLDYDTRQKITSMIGIEHFPNLERLICNDMQITNLDVSKNIELKNLECPATPITSLDVSNNTALEKLICHNTRIKSLDVSNNTALQYLSCGMTQITSLDVSKNTALENLGCEITQITSLDVSNNTALQTLYCYNTRITNLDVSKNTALRNLDCNYAQITNLDISKNTALERLNCNGNPITNLDVSKNTALTNLSCNNTQITNLDVSNNVALRELSCSQIPLTSLDVSNNDALSSLYWGGTNLAWLHIGDKSNYFYSDSSRSNINLGEIDIEFNIQEKFPGIDLNRIININGATLDKTTGIVSGYTNGIPISYTYDCGTAQGNQVILDVSLNFTKPKEESHIIINDDLNKVYDGQAVAEPKNIETTGSTGTVTFEWYAADGTKLDSAPVDAGSYKVKAILEADTNYASAEVEKAFDITKANSTIIINDDLNKVYDGQAVEEPKDIVKTGSTGAVSFEWYTLDGTKLQAAPVNTGSYKVKAILEADTNYAGAEVEKVFDITKADSTIIINDDLNKVYDGQAVEEPKDIVKTGSTGAVSFEWYTLDGTKLQGAPVDAGSYKVKAILEADGSFIGAETEKAFDITKASSTITINDNLNKVYDGQAVEDPKDIVKTGSAGTVSFEWYQTDGTKLNAAPVDAGSYKVKAILEADTNYASVEVEKEFTISQASSTITINEDLNKVYDGQVVEEPKDIVKTGSTGAVSFEWYQTDGTKLQGVPIDAGSYKVKAILEADTNYISAEVEKEFTISQATNQWTQKLSIQNWVYATPANTPNAVAQFGTVEYTYSTSEDGVYTDVVPSNAGTYWVKASIVATNNYGALEAKQSFMIEKANSSITIHDDLNKAYDGQAVMQPNITQIGSQSAAVYEWYMKNEGVTKADPWTRLSEAPIEIGNYKLVVRVAEDTNYHGATAEVEFSIQEAQQETTPEDSGNEGANTSTGNQVEGVQTGDRTQVGLWTMLLGLATGIMLFFTKKKSKKEK